MKKTKLFIPINGVAESGKDLFIDWVREATSLPVFNFSTVGTPKLAAIHYFGWDGVKDERGRKLIQRLKAASKEYNNGPFEEALDRFAKLNSGLFFCHSREWDEIESYRAHFGPDICKTVCIINHEKAEKTPDNDSDLEAKTIPPDFYDFTYVNDGRSIDALRCMAVDFVLDTVGQDRR
jgi:hypothetical protein